MYDRINIRWHWPDESAETSSSLVADRWYSSRGNSSDRDAYKLLVPISASSYFLDLPACWWDPNLELKLREIKTTLHLRKLIWAQSEVQSFHSMKSFALERNISLLFSTTRTTSILKSLTTSCPHASSKKKLWAVSQPMVASGKRAR